MGSVVTVQPLPAALHATQKHLAPMTKIVHSRVYAQALTLGCLVGSAAAEYYDAKYNARTVEDDPYVYRAPKKAR